MVQAHAFNADLFEHLGWRLIVPLVRLEARYDIRVNRIKSAEALQCPG